MDQPPPDETSSSEKRGEFLELMAFVIGISVCAIALASIPFLLLIGHWYPPAAELAHYICDRMGCQ